MKSEEIQNIARPAREALACCEKATALLELASQIFDSGRGPEDICVSAKRYNSPLTTVKAYVTGAQFCGALKQVLLNESDRLLAEATEILDNRGSEFPGPEEDQ